MSPGPSGAPSRDRFPRGGDREAEAETPVQRTLSWPATSPERGRLPVRETQSAPFNQPALALARGTAV